MTLHWVVVFVFNYIMYDNLSITIKFIFAFAHTNRQHIMENLNVFNFPLMVRPSVWDTPICLFVLSLL